MSEYAFSWSGGSAVQVGPNPPADPQDGELWWATQDSSGVSVPSGIVLFDQTLAADTATIDTGASIPAGYAALLVFAQLRTDQTGTDLSVTTRVNGDTGNNYDMQVWSGSNASTFVSAADRGISSWVLDSQGTNASDNYLGSITMWLPNYSGTTWWKSGNYSAGVPYSQSTAMLSGSYALGWRSTAAINRLSFSPATGNFKAGSRLTVVGIGPLSAAAGPGADGWINDSNETWTYASFTAGPPAVGTFTVPGDVTAKYPIGTRIKLTQNGAVAYFVVSAATTVSSGTSTVTVTGGTDYTLANAPIVANYHSYEANPQGYPTWFNFNAADTGFSSLSVTQAVFSLLGKHLTVYRNSNGNSNSTSYTWTMPLTLSLSPNDAGFMVENSGGWSQGQAQTSGSTVTMFTNLTNAFSNSGLKGCRGFFHAFV